MSAPLLRRACRALVSHAGKVMPARRSTWAEAMAAEVEQVEDDRSALGFALGCVATSYGQWTQAAFTTANLGRWALVSAALAAAWFSFVIADEVRIERSITSFHSPAGELSAQHMEVIAKHHAKTAYIQTLPAWTIWLHFLWPVLFVLGAWRLARRRRDARLLLAAAAGGVALHALAQWLTPGYREIASHHAISIPIDLFGSRQWGIGLAGAEAVTLQAALVIVACLALIGLWRLSRNDRPSAAQMPRDFAHAFWRFVRPLNLSRLFIAAILAAAALERLQAAASLGMIAEADYGQLDPKDLHVLRAVYFANMSGLERGVHFISPLLAGASAWALTANRRFAWRLLAASALVAMTHLAYQWTQPDYRAWQLAQARAAAIAAEQQGGQSIGIFAIQAAALVLAAAMVLLVWALTRPRQEMARRTAG